MHEVGLPSDANAPDTITLDRSELKEENFAQAYQTLVGQYDKQLTLQGLPTLKMAGSSSPAQQSGAWGPRQLHLSTNEDADLNVHTPAARGDRRSAMEVDTITAILEAGRW